MKIITMKQVDTIIKDYTINLIPIIDIAKQYGVTRQAIYKILKRYEIDTRNGKMTVSCTACGTEFERHRCQIRKRKRVFCSDVCYHTYLGTITSSTYRPWRQGQRIAIAEVSKVFKILDGMVVHHVDNNNWNNGLDNLMVFKNQGDHIRYHRGFDVDPVWP